jgi:hypothetical protein
VQHEPQDEGRRYNMFALVRQKESPQPLQRQTGSITFSMRRIIMARSRIKAKGRRESGTYVGIPHAITRSREYAALSASAVKLIIDLADQFNGSNNGDLQATWPFMQDKGWRSKATLYRAINELLHREFVIVSNQGRLTSLSPRRYAAMGGSFAVVWVAAFTWNGWQASVEYADMGPQYVSIPATAFIVLHVASLYP